MIRKANRRWFDFVRFHFKSNLLKPHVILCHGHNSWPFPHPVHRALWGVQFHCSCIPNMLWERLLNFNTASHHPSFTRFSRTQTTGHINHCASGWSDRNALSWSCYLCNHVVFYYSGCLHSSFFGLFHPLMHAYFGLSGTRVWVHT